jgi:hypothetical protein
VEFPPTHPYTPRLISRLFFFHIKFYTNFRIIYLKFYSINAAIMMLSAMSVIEQRLG